MTVCISIGNMDIIGGRSNEMIAIDRTMKCVFLTQSKAMHDNRQTFTVVWVQRVNLIGDVIGVGYFRIREYTHYKGVGMRNRIIAMMEKGT